MTGQKGSRLSADLAGGTSTLLRFVRVLVIKWGLTIADDSCVFVMAAVVLAPAQVEARGQLLFLATTAHVVQKDGAGPVAEEGHAGGSPGGAAAELSAHHVGVVHVPIVVAHRPPNGLVEDLHPPLTAVVPIHHPDGR